MRAGKMRENNFEFHSENKQRFKNEGIAVTGPGRLLCQNIVHMKARNTLKSWLESVIVVLAEVENRGHSSVSFPAVGTGLYIQFLVYRFCDRREVIRQVMYLQLSVLTVTNVTWSGYSELLL